MPNGDDDVSSAGEDFSADDGVGADFGMDSPEDIESVGEGQDISADSEAGPTAINAGIVPRRTDDAEGVPLLTSEQILEQGRALALSGVPLQLSNLLNTLAQLRARAQGSTAEIFPAISRQLNDLRTQYSDASAALARRLGASGGGQVERGRQRLLGQATTRFARTAGQAQQEGFAGLLNVLSGIQPFLSGAARPPNVSVATSPFNTGQAGEGIAGLISLAQRLQPNPGIDLSGPANVGQFGLPATSEATLFGPEPQAPPFSLERT